MPINFDFAETESSLNPTAKTFVPRSESLKKSLNPKVKEYVPNVLSIASKICKGAKPADLGHFSPTLIFYQR